MIFQQQQQMKKKFISIKRFTFSITATMLKKISDDLKKKKWWWWWRYYKDQRIFFFLSNSIILSNVYTHTQGTIIHMRPRQKKKKILQKKNRIIHTHAYKDHRARIIIIILDIIIIIITIIIIIIRSFCVLNVKKKTDRQMWIW